MENKSTFWSTIFSGISGILAVIIVIWIPGYFLWGTIRDIFLDIPSNRIEFRNLLEASHGVIFYIFAGIMILWWVLFNVAYRILMTIGLFIEETSFKWRAITMWLWLLFITTGILPYLSYMFISESLFWYYFDFFEMLSFIGTFELMLLFVTIFEAFIWTQFIAPVTRIILYSYLLIQFI